MGVGPYGLPTHSCSSKGVQIDISHSYPPKGPESTGVPIHHGGPEPTEASKHCECPMAATSHEASMAAGSPGCPTPPAETEGSMLPLEVSMPCPKVSMPRPEVFTPRSKVSTPCFKVSMPPALAEVSTPPEGSIPPKVSTLSKGSAPHEISMPPKGSMPS